MSDRYCLLLLASNVWRADSFGADFLCNRIPGLTPKQREICETSPDALAVIGDGSRLGVTECQHQFKFNRWNCTPVANNHFSHVSVIGSREAAFLYAISSAGVTYAVTQACARGNISSCGCAPPTTTNDGRGDPLGHHGNGKERDGWEVAAGWRWGGCSADVKYAVRLARKFLDSREVEGDARSLMNLHNNKAGRKAVQTSLDHECKCHGVSGSCTLKTCWLKLSAFRKIGEQLMDKYKKAKPVMAIPTGQQQEKAKMALKSTTAKSAMVASTIDLPNQVQNTEPGPPRPRRSLVLVRTNSRPGPDHHHGHRGHHHSHRHHHLQKTSKYQRSVSSAASPRPKRSELVYLDPSPNYCDPDAASGALGTRSRRCFHPRELNSTSLESAERSEEESCDILCCGRGYNTHQMVRRWKCHCKFRWCCEVECQECSERVEIYTCN